MTSPETQPPIHHTERVAHPITVLSTIGFTESQLARLRAVSPRLQVVQHQARERAETTDLLRAHPDAEVLYTMHQPTDWGVAPGLRWVQFHSAGVDHIDLSALPAHIQATSASGVHSVVMAEHTFTLVLALRRKIPQMILDQPQHHWPPNRWAIYAQPTLRGQVMGILGYGSIGREVARLAQAFGMTVLALKRNPTQTSDRGFMLPGVGDPGGEIPAAYYGPDQRHELLGRCDVVVNLLPATPQTEHFIGATEFAAMRPTALFLNLGRGKTVDQQALALALQHGTILGAALDVFDPEPLPADNPLWSIDPRQLIISPHVSAHFPGYDEVASQLLAANLERYLGSQPLLNVVHHEHGY